MTASSAGTSKPLCETSTSARLTCLCAVQPGQKASSGLSRDWKAHAQQLAQEQTAAEEPRKQADGSKELQQAVTTGAGKKKQMEREINIQKKAKVQKKADPAQGVVRRKPGEHEAVVEFPDEIPPTSTLKAKKKKKKRPA
jgi:hypothetical protein